MSGIFKSVIDKYNYVIYELADSRTKDWWGVENPLVIISIASAYLYFCKSLGPRLMKHRKPFELKNVLFCYNVFQVCFSIFIFYECAVYIFDRRFNLACEPVYYVNKPRALRIAATAWYFYIAKITELLDTIFFILRKKFNQATFLHVYHHTLMALAVWYAVKYHAGGHNTFLGFFNSMVHIMMYTYYLISSFGPEYQKYVWWKKHVTIIQLVQFVFIFIHNFMVFFYKCDYPKHLNVINCVNSLIFIYLFGKFYFRSYKGNAKNKASLETKKKGSITAKMEKYDGERDIMEKSR